jgi:hypothetical protein
LIAGRLNNLHRQALQRLFHRRVPFTRCPVRRIPLQQNEIRHRLNGHQAGFGKNVSSWQAVIRRVGIVAAKRARCWRPKSTVSVSTAILTRCCALYEVAMKRSNPLNSNNRLTFRIPPLPGSGITKWAAGCNRCKNTTPSGDSKNLTTAGSASNRAWRCCQC